MISQSLNVFGIYSRTHWPCVFNKMFIYSVSEEPLKTKAQVGTKETFQKRLEERNGDRKGKVERGRERKGKEKIYM